MLWYDIIYTYMYTHIYWLILRQRWVCGRWVTNQLEPWDMMGMTSRNWEVMFTYFIIYIYMICTIYVVGDIYIYWDIWIIIVKIGMGMIPHDLPGRKGWSWWYQEVAIWQKQHPHTGNPSVETTINHHWGMMEMMIGSGSVDDTALGLEHVSNIIGIQGGAPVR